MLKSIYKVINGGNTGMLTAETKTQEIKESLPELDGAVSENIKALTALFEELTVTELEGAILASSDRSEKTLYRTLLNLKMQIDQEKVINQTLL